jgi:RNA polymerase sigma-70 factor (ECF subfamily)
MIMNRHSENSTSPTLLGRLRVMPNDEAAWAEFVDRYGRQIYAWARQWNLQDADAEEVAQIVLARLAQRLRTFVYDEAGSFRGWLRTFTRHAWSDFLQARERPDRGSGDSQVRACLESAEAGDDLAARLEQQFDQELLEVATARIRLRVAPSSWDAFRLTALEGHSGAEAAQQLGMPVTAVFKARSRVQQMLQDEVRKLDRGET